MKYLTTLFYCFILPVASLAQKGDAADSLVVYRQSAASITMLRKDATQLRASHIDTYGYAGLTYRYGTGSFRLPQVAQTSTAVTFNSEGIVALGRFKLLGYFSFERAQDDSLTYNLRGIQNSDQPSYIFASKAGNYGRQIYTGGGIISYELLKDKFYLSSGMDYFYNSSAGTVDPRLSSQTHKIIFNPEITYKLHQHYFGLGITAGYSEEKNTVSFKNDNYVGSTLYPDRIAYLNFGYGYSPIRIDKAIFLNSRFSGLNMNYAGRFADWNFSAKFSYQLANDKLRNDYETSIGAGMLQEVQIVTKKLHFLAAQSTARHDQQLTLSFSKDNGDDRIIESNSRNWTFRRQDAQMTYSYLHKSSRRAQTEWIAELFEQHVYKRDASDDVDFSYKYISPQLGLNQYWHSTNKDLITAGLSLSGQFPLNTALNIRGIQTDLFTTGVIYPNEQYWSSTSGRAAFHFNYVTSSIFKDFRTGVNFNTSYQNKLSNNNDRLATGFYPEKGYFTLSMGINLYF
ncbi:DUF6850 family outer membrane beta-barrel protein [Pedobacter sp. MR2016-24]|uniref:DUF6850 family outer membrane beta-barrel protein n=1 Tax=Pedobacter sp. MR2016-24 TaxID=2994466 RepID=UPI0022464075|nr:DUF6850 family outer membrane beta-barrel protein [Pedobacter sp. MR2016-24]MCX2484797.1 hypothetical protein [Pedobacter sp. MR2016-24]